MLNFASLLCSGPSAREVIIISVVGSVALFAAAGNLRCVLGFTVVTLPHCPCPPVWYTVLAAVYLLNGQLVPLQAHPATIPTAVVAWQDPV